MNPSLPGFTRENWRSTIRRYVTGHPDYADMQNWCGIETADIVYEDKEGTLTEKLVEADNLPSGYRGCRPRYYIEVKTTPGPWDTPFHMSHPQYEKVSCGVYSSLLLYMVINFQYKMKGFSTQDSIYVIFRVFNLYTDQIGVKLYVDPVKLESEGRLIFAADRWTVRPRS